MTDYFTKLNLSLILSEKSIKLLISNYLLDLKNFLAICSESYDTVKFVFS